MSTTSKATSDMMSAPQRKTTATDAALPHWRDPVMDGNPHDTSFASYMAPLVACLAASEGPVLECGLGYWSTPFLHRYCLATGRLLFSLDETREWVQRFEQYFLLGWHYVIDCSYPRTYQEELTALAKKAWGVVLMDHSPGWRRATDALTLKHAQFILVHDFSGDEVNSHFTPEIMRNWESVHIAQFSPSTLVLAQCEMPYFPKFRAIR